MLYRAGQARSARKQSRKLEEDFKQAQMSNTVFTSGSTKKLMERKKKDSFAKIFRMLDSDQDGQISANSIDIY